MSLTRRGFLTGVSALALASGSSALYAKSLWSEGKVAIAERDKDIPLIGLEEHYATAEMQKINGIKFPPGYPRFDINEVGSGRITHMNEAGFKCADLIFLNSGCSEYSR